MSERRAYIDRGVGETRGVVTLDDRPERLIIRREDDDPRLIEGARLVARISDVDAALSTAFLDLGKGAEAILPFKPDARPVRGAALEVEIRNEPRRGKLAVARPIGPGSGDPRLLLEAPDVAALLRLHSKSEALVEGREAAEVADEAEAEALEVLHPLIGGGLIAIEPTRALTAVDVDLSDRKGADAKRVTRQANIEALHLAARLLRLKGLGGIVVMDLVGRGHDGAALMAAARAAFGPDNPGVAIGPVGRFGTMELSLPRRSRPVGEILNREDGGLSDRSLAHRLIRRLAAEAQAQPGARLTGSVSPAVAAEAARWMPQLLARYGARLSVLPDPSLPRETFKVGAL